MRHRAAGKPKSPAASMARLSVVFAAGGSGLPVGAQKSAPKQKGGDDLNSRQNVNATKLLAHSASGVKN